MKYDIKQLLSKWQPVLDSSIVQKRAGRNDELLVQFLEEQYHHHVKVRQYDLSSPFSSWALPLVARVANKLICDQVISNIVEIDDNPEYEHLHLSYSTKTLKELEEHAVNFEDYIREILEGEIEQFYVGYEKSLTLPLAPMITFKDFSMYTKNIESDRLSVIVKILKPIQHPLEKIFKMGDANKMKKFDGWGSYAERNYERE